MHQLTRPVRSIIWVYAQYIAESKVKHSTKQRARLNRRSKSTLVSNIKPTHSWRKSIWVVKEREEYLIGQAKLNRAGLDPEENGEKGGGNDEGPGDRGIVCEREKNTSK